MKTIGFIDYYLSEWHADNYPLWIKEICEKTGKEFCVAYAWAEMDKSPIDGKTTDEWCKEFNVQQCNSIAEVCEKADYVLILAPSNPEKHLQYAKEVFKFGKNTYIDKTFAPDKATAEEIFALAENYGVKFFSSSALRYAEELTGKENAKAVMTTGEGSNLEEYIIHQIEMVVKLLGVGAKQVRVENAFDRYTCSVKYVDDRQATLIFAPCLPFSACATNPNGTSEFSLVLNEDYFLSLLSDILRFYEEGTTSFDTQQTLEVMKIREGIIKAKNHIGEWLPL